MSKSKATGEFWLVLAGFGWVLASCCFVLVTLSQFGLAWAGLNRFFVCDGTAFLSLIKAAGLGRRFAIVTVTLSAVRTRLP